MYIPKSGLPGLPLYNIDKKQIVIDGCASLGYHYINIELYKDIIAKVRIKLEK